MQDDPWFGEATAATYDDDTAELADPVVLGPQVDRLAGLAAGGPALEMAIGTGRVAIPLAARGLRVAGIELSRAMVARMRAKPGGSEAAIPVTIGDMSTVTAPGAGTFTLVYLVFNTIMNLTTQAAQVACFRNAASHLAPGGAFLVETMVPELRRLPPGERRVVFDLGDDHIGIDEYDPVSQGLISHHVTVRADGRVDRSSLPFRYVWPAELDLMAQLAGMVASDRWGGWQGEPFTDDSRSHVSVWRRSPG
jgi:SAM-dependent methyltransferase